MCPRGLWAVLRARRRRRRAGAGARSLFSPTLALPFRPSLSKPPSAPAHPFYPPPSPELAYNICMRDITEHSVVSLRVRNKWKQTFSLISFFKVALPPGGVTPLSPVPSYEGPSPGSKSL